MIIIKHEIENEKDKKQSFGSNFSPECLDFFKLVVLRSSSITLLKSYIINITRIEKEMMEKR